MKKHFSLLLICFLSVSIFLMGCATVNVNNQENTSNNNQTNDQGNVESEEQVELVMYSWRAEDREAYEVFIEKFESIHPNIRVKFEPFQSTEYNTILNNALVSGTGPDIVQLRPYQGAASVADSDYLVPLEGVPGLDEINEDFLDAAKGSDGKVYGVPLALNAGVIFFNKDIFEEHHLEVPETWGEFLEVSDKLNAAGVVPIAQSGRAAYVLSLVHGVIAPPAYNGNEFVEEILAGSADLKDARFVESVNRMKQLEQYFPKDFIALDDQDAQRMFYSEQAAMYINGSYRLETFESNIPDMNLGVIPSLAEEKGGNAPVTTWVDGSYGVVKNTKHQEEALLFMEFLASQEFGQLFADELNRLGAINGVNPSHPIVNEIAAAVEKESTPYLLLVHFGDGSPTTKTVFEDHLQGMYLGELSPQEVIEEAQKNADRASE
ncbi:MULTISPECIES: sugar ABC transporter substrate-binding protein [unclassified Sutcliffiella]|uniref:ABC transporter substrate-binding protein n=1 Tax=unclassified Sutcliffiella TaxID=2837532 RepID=UPI0030CE7A13